MKVMCLKSPAGAQKASSVQIGGLAPSGDLDLRTSILEALETEKVLQICKGNKGAS